MCLSRGDSALVRRGQCAGHGGDSALGLTEELLTECEGLDWSEAYEGLGWLE